MHTYALTDTHSEDPSTANAHLTMQASHHGRPGFQHDPDCAPPYPTRILERCTHEALWGAQRELRPTELSSGPPHGGAATAQPPHRRGTRARILTQRPERQGANKKGGSTLPGHLGRGFGDITIG